MMTVRIIREARLPLSRSAAYALRAVIACPLTAAVVKAVAFNRQPGVIGPYKVAAADFTGDGLTDLLVAFHDAGDVVVEKGDGHGNFSPVSRSPLCARQFGMVGGAYNISSGDIDGDGRLDVAVGCRDNVVIVATNRGDGTFTQRARFLTEGSAKGVKLQDLNGDSRVDLLYTSRGKPTAEYLAGGTLFVRPGRGDGTFGDPLTLDAGNSAYYVDSGDLNGDGIPDLVAANQRKGGVSYWLNPGVDLFDGSTKFEPRRILKTSQPSINDVRTADINGDGFIDIVTAALEGKMSTFVGKGDGMFGEETVYEAGDSAAFVAVADFGRDGDADLVVSHWQADYVSVFTNDGTGNFTRRDYQAGMGTYGLDVFDSNGNGFPDIVVASWVEGALTILRSDGGDRFSAATTLRRSFSPR